jgi:hypothetical protein
VGTAAVEEVDTEQEAGDGAAADTNLFVAATVVDARSRTGPGDGVAGEIEGDARRRDDEAGAGAVKQVGADADVAVTTVPQPIGVATDAGPARTIVVDAPENARAARMATRETPRRRCVGWWSWSEPLCQVVAVVG